MCKSLPIDCDNNTLLVCNFVKNLQYKGEKAIIIIVLNRLQFARGGLLASQQLEYILWNVQLSLIAMLMFQGRSKGDVVLDPRT